MPVTSSRRSVLQGGLFGVACACACVAPAFAFGADAPAGKFVCPPCGCDSDGKTFDAAGACPSCGMGLIPAPAPDPKPADPSPPKLGGAEAGTSSPAAEPRSGFLLKV